MDCWKKPSFRPILIAVGEIKCYISYIRSPSFFFAQLTGAEEELDALAHRISCSVKELCGDSLTITSVGMPCLARYSQDGQWYRAEVTEVDQLSRGVTVRFVDYGNVESITEPQTGLKQINDDLLLTPAQAVLCCLQGEDAEIPMWSSTARERFNEFLDESLFLAFSETSPKHVHTPSSAFSGIYAVKAGTSASNLDLSTVLGES